MRKVNRNKSLINVKKYLLRLYLPMMSNSKIKQGFINWIDALIHEDALDRRLLISLAIDSKHKPYVVRTYLKLFEIIDYESVSKPAVKFENALKENPNLHIMSEEVFLPSKHNIEYTRVIKYDTFYNYFASTILGGIPISPTQNHIGIHKLRVSSIFNNKAMKLLGPPWRKVSWVTCAKDFAMILKKYKFNPLSPDSNITGKIIAHLGIKVEPEEHYVYIDYPKDIDFNTYLPLVVNSSWMEKNFFISSNRSDWGATRHWMGGKHKGMKERIHLDSTNHYLCTPVYIGRLNKQSTDLTNIESEALNRFH